MKKGRALEGIKICDFTWAIAGAMATTRLAEYGAEVVKIESNINSPDGIRYYAPFRDRIVGANRAGFFAAINNSKYSIALNLKHPRSLDIAKKIATWSDVVVDNFSARILEKIGLGYEDLKKIKPDIIMVSASPQGQTGPCSTGRIHGHTAAALAGLTGLTGWPDREPAGHWVPYVDYIVPIYLAIAVMVAIDYHRKTGKGQYIDLSQYECAVSFIAPAILDYTVNGRVLERMGNGSTSASPHGVYRCKGNDRWCSIVINNDEEWESFCRIIGKPKWTKDPKFATLLSRLKNVDELDKEIENWTANYPPEVVMEMMQAAGVPAGIVANGQDLQEDPQIKHRGRLQILDHPEMGPTVHEGPPFKLSKTPSEMKMPAPCLGEHTEYVCTKILGMSNEEFIELLNEGVFE
jgi:crotonobetainyl-CoA:carnitine CoA-transferase CaiB-like acyl-CoA transferase